MLLLWPLAQPSKALGDLSSLMGSLQELQAEGGAGVGAPSTSGRGGQGGQQQAGAGRAKTGKQRAKFGEAVKSSKARATIT